jgi:hypothetical protein
MISMRRSNIFRFLGKTNGGLGIGKESTLVPWPKQVKTALYREISEHYFAAEMPGQPVALSLHAGASSQVRGE